MALGAESADVIWHVIAEVAFMLVIGAVTGAICAMALGRFVASMLFDLKPADPFALIAAGLFLAIVALVSGYFPARRAAHIDPMVALRHE